jgi:hypothetical protein
MTYKIRLGGTREFVSAIDLHASHCYPPGEVEFVKGWDNPSALVYKTYKEAEAASHKVMDIEGFHTTIERFTRDD